MFVGNKNIYYFYNMINKQTNTMSTYKINSKELLDAGINGGPYQTSNTTITEYEIAYDAANIPSDIAFGEFEYDQIEAVKGAPISRKVDQGLIANGVIVVFVTETVYYN